jgi:recombination protein RecA
VEERYRAMKKLIDPKVKEMSVEQKHALLKTEIALINKKFKKNMVSFGWNKEMNRIPFKSKELNRVTGGGVPCGRFSVIWGSKGSAKTTNCYDLVANAQKMGKTCLWIDFERSFDPIWAASQGVVVEELVVAPAFENAEQAMDMIIKLTKSKAIDLIIIDSIQGLSPVGEQETKKGVEKSLADDTMALLARKLSQFFRVSAGTVAESDCTVVLIGQTRMDLGGFITLEKLSGGNALEHWSSLTIHVRRGKAADAPTASEEVEEEDEDGNVKKKKKIKPIGIDMVARVDKSKVGPDEGKECHVKFLFGKGIEGDDQG